MTVFVTLGAIICGFVLEDGEGTSGCGARLLNAFRRGGLGSVGSVMGVTGEEVVSLVVLSGVSGASKNEQFSSWSF